MKEGTITPALLVITGAFMAVIYGLLILLSLQVDFSQRQLASEQALNIAEAGVNYYRWHLAHDPDDYQDGTGEDGVYTHTYQDPEGGEIGNFDLEILPPEGGSSVVTIRSTGYTNEFPNVKRTIEAQYGIPSLTRFSFLSNASSWYGENITVHGDIHSNNGIRMDGTNTARVTSAKETYSCGSETGCSPTTSRPGVWGSGGDQSLWEFPVPAIDFNAIAFDFAQMRSSAQSNGLYLPNQNQGYHLIFNSNGTVTVRRVTSTNTYNARDAETGCSARPERIQNETTVGTYSIADNPIIFAEHNLWVEGTVRGRVTVVAARFPLNNNAMNIWIANNIRYTTYDGSDALGLVAQNDIYFARNVPTNFQVDAALLAQSGKIIRHEYSGCSGNSGQAVKNSLTLNGAVISYEKSYWNYNSGNTLISGFTTREINYDGNLLFGPPPYFPTSGEYEFINWQEI